MNEEIKITDVAADKGTPDSIVTKKVVTNAESPVVDAIGKGDAPQTVCAGKVKTRAASPAEEDTDYTEDPNAPGYRGEA